MTPLILILLVGLAGLLGFLIGSSYEATRTGGSMDLRDRVRLLEDQRQRLIQTHVHICPDRPGARLPRQREVRGA